jgi:hypothetical protein
MDIEAVRNTLEQASLASLAGGPPAPGAQRRSGPRFRWRSVRHARPPWSSSWALRPASVRRSLACCCYSLSVLAAPVPVVLGLWRSQRALEIAGGLVLILSGLHMLNAYFFFVPGLAA